MAIGTVREWYDDEGWGVLDSEVTPGGCFAPFSSIATEGFRAVAVGDPVTFTWEPAEQDGYAFRAVTVWPTVGAYGSTLTLTGTDRDTSQVEHGGLLTAAEGRAAALVSGDPDNLRAVLHPRFTWSTHRGDVLDRASYVAGNTDGSLTWLEQRLDDVRVAVVGDTGVLTCVVRDRVVRDGREQTFTMPVTQTWVRERGSWRCLAGHAGPSQAG